MDFWTFFTWLNAELINKKQQIIGPVNEDLNIITKFYIGLI